MKKTDKYSLKGKAVAVTGADGGIGQHICRFVLSCGGNLIMLDRNTEKSEKLSAQLKTEFENAEIQNIHLDLSDFSSVNSAADILQKNPPDVLIHNAGVYNIPREQGYSGYDSIFEINFVSPYYITKKLLPFLKEKGSKVIAVGSVAHNYSKTDMNDTDFSFRKGCAKAYGNSKRFLMYALSELMKDQKTDFAIAHPGITVTAITDHYPKWLYKIIKYPMKVIFMKPEVAAHSIEKAVFEDVPYGCWAGPRFFDVWGKPAIKKLKTADSKEKHQIYERAEQIYKKLLSE